MGLQTSMFKKIRLFIFGNIPKSQLIQYSETDKCSKCEIRSLFLAELKKTYKEEHQTNVERTKEDEEWPDSTDEDFIFKQE